MTFLRQDVFSLLNDHDEGYIEPPRWSSWLERSPRKRKVECSNPSRDRPNSLKQVVTDYCQTLGNRCDYKQMPSVTVGATR